jgi:hypothetical protein
MSRHAYPTSAMLGDYLRAAAGLVPTVAILAAMPVGAIGASVLGGFAVLFAVFGIRTALRHGTRFELAEGVLRACGVLRGSIALRELQQMKLSYYSTRRDRRDGWMQLELCSGSSRLRFDSRVEGFDQLVAISAQAAEARGLSLNAATVANLQAMGLRRRPAAPELHEAAGEWR